MQQAVHRAASENGLPDFLVARILAVAAEPDAYPDAEAEIAVLLAMLPDYDTYAQTGYMGMGVSNLVL